MDHLFMQLLDASLAPIPNTLLLFNIYTAHRDYLDQIHEVLHKRIENTSELVGARVEQQGGMPCPSLSPYALGRNWCCFLCFLDAVLSESWTNGKNNIAENKY